MEIMTYLCRAEQRGRMMAATITSDYPRKRMNVPSRDIHSCRTTRTDSSCPILTKVSTLTAWNQGNRKPQQYG